MISDNTQIGLCLINMALAYVNYRNWQTNKNLGHKGLAYMCFAVMCLSLFIVVYTAFEVLT